MFLHSSGEIFSFGQKTNFKHECDLNLEARSTESKFEIFRNRISNVVVVFLKRGERHRWLRPGRESLGIDLADRRADGISSERGPSHQPLNRIKRNCNVAVIIRMRSRYCRECPPAPVDTARFIARIDFAVSLAAVNKNPGLISCHAAPSRVIKALRCVVLARYFRTLPHRNIDRRTRESKTRGRHQFPFLLPYWRIVQRSLQFFLNSSRARQGFLFRVCWTF